MYIYHVTSVRSKSSGSFYKNINSGTRMANNLFLSLIGKLNRIKCVAELNFL